MGQDVVSIKGIVRSSRGELLGGVNVHIKDLKLTAETDREGKYSFSAIPLNVTIIFSRL